MLKEIEINIRILHWRSLQSSKDSNIKGFDSFFNILKISLSDSACHFMCGAVISLLFFKANVKMVKYAFLVRGQLLPLSELHSIDSLRRTDVAPYNNQVFFFINMDLTNNRIRNSR